MRANAWEGIGKELKIKQIKRKFYVSSRDVRIVCPWPSLLLRDSQLVLCLVLWHLYPDLLFMTLQI
jgi:hypothetical protein